MWKSNSEVDVVAWKYTQVQLSLKEYANKYLITNYRKSTSILNCLCLTQCFLKSFIPINAYHNYKTER